MDAIKDRDSEAVDTVDIPSDFFDDFTNDAFIDGLSVIDSWDFNKEIRISPKKDSSTVEKDLGDLISEIKNKPTSHSLRQKRSTEKERTKRTSRFNDLIKPGSRRDPNKTNEAIRKDKEEKVKVYLAKHLEDDLRPPGTELDDYYNEDVSLKPVEKKPPIVEETLQRSSRKRSRERRSSPVKKRKSPRRSPRKSPRRSPRKSPRRSPRKSPRRSPRKSPRRNSRKSPKREDHYRRSPGQLRLSPRRIRISPSLTDRLNLRYSPRRTSRRSPIHRSPLHWSPQHKKSPLRRSPMSRRSRSPIRSRRSRSPRRRELRHSRSKSIGRGDSFLYPIKSDPVYPPSIVYPEPGSQYVSPAALPFIAPQEQAYIGPYGSGYDYGVPPVAMGVGPPVGSMCVPQPMPGMEHPQLMPVMGPPQPICTMGSIPPGPSSSVPLPAIPSMVPAPQVLTPQSNPPKPLVEHTNPYDGLAKLYADGKISKEDYLKLAPNKGVSHSMDTQTRVKVLNRCNSLMSKLTKLLLPRRLVVNMKAIGPEQKCLPPKHCSPLKRQANIEFKYTTPNSSTAQERNKRLVDAIITTLGLETVVARPKGIPKNMKDAETQTTKTHCDVCEIRENTKTNEASTSIDPAHFSSTTHTQVIEAELLSSKAVFNPSGSVGDSTPMSIAHMTPAQLVSQLAARAKTLKQTDGEQSSAQGQFNRWKAPNNYNYGGHGGPGGGQQYQNYYRY